MVVMSAPATADTGVTHERVATPFTCTVQAPQCAPPRPNLVPFMSRTSRSTQSSGISFGTSTVVGFPLTLNVTGIVGPFLRFASEFSVYLAYGCSDRMDVYVRRSRSRSRVRLPIRVAAWATQHLPAQTLGADTMSLTRHR